MLKRELGSKVSLSIAHTQARKVGVNSIPYPGKYLLATLQELISKAYK